jgi:hypothetical protein
MHTYAICRVFIGSCDNYLSLTFYHLPKRLHFRTYTKPIVVFTFAYHTSLRGLRESRLYLPTQFKCQTSLNFPICAICAQTESLPPQSHGASADWEFTSTWLATWEREKPPPGALNLFHQPNQQTNLSPSEPSRNVKALMMACTGSLERTLRHVQGRVHLRRCT